MDGRALRLHRAVAGIGRDALAKRLGVNPATIWRWESGDSSLPQERVRELLVALYEEAPTEPSVRDVPVQEKIPA